MIFFILCNTMLELGIVETRNIIKTIAEKYHYDFSDYALTSFKQRLEKIIDQQNIKFIEYFNDKLLEDASFFETILHTLEVPSTEMFRDPSCWRILHDELLPALMKETMHDLKVWLPNSVSGDELFSFCIILQEMGLIDHVRITVSALSDTSIETIRSGQLQNNKLEISTDNYKRVFGKDELTKYYAIRKGELVRDVSLLKNVTFFKQNIFLEPVPQGIKLVFFRNKMIYYNQTLQSRILKLFYNHLTTNAILIIGTKESLNTFYGTQEFSLINSSESIYKRK